MSNYHKALDDLKHTLNILYSSIDGFYAGNTSMYRVIAVQLGLLLCDGEKDKNSLLPRLFKSVKLHALWGSWTKEQEDDYIKKFGHSYKEGLVFQMPAMVDFDGSGGSKIIKLFDENREPINIREWLNQELFNKNITIRQLIKSVRNKESAHADKNYDDTLRFTKSVKLVDEDIHIKFIVAIGEYILKIVNMALKGETRYIS